MGSSPDDGQDVVKFYRGRKVRDMGVPYVVMDPDSRFGVVMVHIETWANGQVECASVPWLDVVTEHMSD